MLDAIRQRQIDESLNDIRDFNRMVFDIERRNAGLNPDNVLPYTQINPEAIEATTAQVQLLLPLLEKKRVAMGELRHGARAAGVTMTQGAAEVTNTQEVVHLYNALVQGILTDIHSQPAQTSQERIRQLRKALLPIDYLVKRYIPSCDTKSRLYTALGTMNLRHSTYPASCKPTQCIV